MSKKHDNRRLAVAARLNAKLLGIKGIDAVPAPLQHEIKSCGLLLRELSDGRCVAIYPTAETRYTDYIAAKTRGGDYGNAAQ